MIEKGYFLIADISGYTLFLTRSELDHATDILKNLFERMLAGINPPLEISNIQGDAILTYAPEQTFLQPQTLIEIVEKLYFDFRQQLERMRINTTCTCKACSNMASLDLKLFLHYGEYVLQEFGSRRELGGADVILVHRMMKNRVKEVTGKDGYALISKAAADALNAGALIENLLPHEETYEHLGRVEMVIYLLGERWEAERERRRIVIADEDIWVRETMDYPVPPSVVWDYLTDPESLATIMGVDAVTRIDGLGGRVRAGAQMHCVHSDGSIDYEIIDWSPGERVVTEALHPILGVRYRAEDRLTPLETGTRYENIVEKPSGGGGWEEMTDMVSQMNREALNRLDELIRRDIAQGRIKPVGAGPEAADSGGSG